MADPEFKEFTPAQCGWLLLSKKFRMGETHVGRRVRFQPHEKEVVMVEVKSKQIES